MKKLTSILCAGLALAFGVSAFSGCFNTPETPENKEQKVMNISLNPEVEFVLDEEDKVITVNALNEEGNLIISAEAFADIEGKSAEDAAKLFVEVATQTGYLVSGSATVGDNEISISLSGDLDNAKALYEDIKAEMSAALSAENVTASIEQAAAITEAHLKALLEECAPYIQTAEMEYEELVAALAEQRKETAEYYSQELKKAYYEAKEFAMQQAEFEALRAHLDFTDQIMFDGATALYNVAVKGIEQVRKTFLVDESSPYQQALAFFREAKANYLKARYDYAIGNVNVSVELTEEELENLKANVQAAEDRLMAAGNAANEKLDEAKALVTTRYNEVLAILEEHSIKASAYIDEISAKQKEKQQAFFEEFEEDYAAAKEAAKHYWNSSSEADKAE